VASKAPGQSRQPQLGQPGILERIGEAVPDRGEQRGRPVSEPAGDEAEHGAAWLVEPLRVVRYQQYRRGRCCLADQL
jgi:hypothetical protein